LSCSYCVGCSLPSPYRGRAGGKVFWREHSARRVKGILRDFRNSRDLTGSFCPNLKCTVRLQETNDVRVGSKADIDVAVVRMTGRVGAAFISETVLQNVRQTGRSFIAPARRPPKGIDLLNLSRKHASAFEKGLHLDRGDIN